MDLLGKEMSTVTLQKYEALIKQVLFPIKYVFVLLVICFWC